MFAGNGSFNKGRLMNIGYQIVKDRYGNFSRCIIFHDVDLIPEDDRNMYTCAQWPKHMSPSFFRLQHQSIEIIRPPSIIGRYKMLLHNQRPQEMNNLQLLRTVTKRYKYDGLSQLKDYNYRILSISLKNLYTHFLIDIGLPKGSEHYRAYSIRGNNYNFSHKNYNQPMKVDQDEKFNIETKIANNLYAFIEKESQNRLTIQKLQVLMKAREIIIEDENKV
uniref:Galactosyltransferase N-terminal domain-containing protein n=1 Tax=Romanomermis culicivorax TaxID=13658 RepID=A0A915HNU4_ROMCU